MSRYSPALAASVGTKAREMLAVHAQAEAARQYAKARQFAADPRMCRHAATVQGWAASNARYARECLGILGTRRVTAERLAAGMVLVLDGPDQLVRVSSVAPHPDTARVYVAGNDTATGEPVYLDDLNPTRYFDVQE